MNRFAAYTSKCNKWTKSNNLPEDMTDFQRMSMHPDADGQLRFSGRNKDREHFCNITTDLKEYKKRGLRARRRNHEASRQLSKAPDKKQHSKKPNEESSTILTTLSKRSLKEPKSANITAAAKTKVFHQTSKSPCHRILKKYTSRRNKTIKQVNVLKPVCKTRSLDELKEIDYIPDLEHAQKIKRENSKRKKVFEDNLKNVKTKQPKVTPKILLELSNTDEDDQKSTTTPPSVNVIIDGGIISSDEDRIEERKSIQKPILDFDAAGYSEDDKEESTAPMPTIDFSDGEMPDFESVISIVESINDSPAENTTNQTDDEIEDF